MRHPSGDKVFVGKVHVQKGPMRLAVLSLVAFAVLPSVTRGQAPVFEITPLHSSIKFDVKASINIAGKFDKWDATLTFTSPDETTGVLEIIIQATSVDTGSGMKNGKLKSKDFFDVERSPVITLRRFREVTIPRPPRLIRLRFT